MVLSCSPFRSPLVTVVTEAKSWDLPSAKMWSVHGGQPRLAASVQVGLSGYGQAAVNPSYHHKDSAGGWVHITARPRHGGHQPCQQAVADC